jgi:hypothetical protein
MRLPPALKAWEPELEGFPFDVGVAVGRLAQRIAALLGPLGHEFDQPEGDIDGYDGLTRRGLPERMLLSDWLLAEEALDEWTRRAAEGELSYLQLARRAPQVSKVIAAVFDGGPDLLGSPRLGQVAALIVMARRARELGAELVWTIAQHQLAAEWHDISPAGVNALLEARGSLPVTAENLEAWRSKMGECDERWLIGGQAIGALGVPGESSLLMEDPFEAVRAIDVQVERAFGVRAAARLELPSDAVATRLLRDPFDTKYEVEGQIRQVKLSFAPESNLVWMGGHALAARSSSGGLLLMRVPSSPRGGVPKPKHHQSGPYLNADYVGYEAGVFALGRLSGDKFSWGTLGQISGAVPGQYSFPENLSFPELTVPKNGRPLHPLWNLNIGQYKPLVLLPNKDLCQLVPHSSSPGLERGTLEVIAKDVLGVFSVEKHLLAIAGQNPARILRLQSNTDNAAGFTKTEQLVVHGEVLSAVWGPSAFDHSSRQSQGLMALQLRKGWCISWNLDGKERLDAVEVAADEDVWGVGLWKKSHDTPVLLVHSPSRRELLLRGPSAEQILASGASFSCAAVSPTTPYIAWQTETDLTVYSVPLGNILARWHWGERS